MEKVIVLVLKGKGMDSADTVKVMSFDTTEEAEDYVQKTNDPEDKYWTRAKIVNSDEEVSTYSPWDN